MLYHAHPNYHNEGRWYDWVVIQYDSGLNPDFKQMGATPSYQPYEVPAKLLSFILDKETGSRKALVHACEFRSDNHLDSVLTEVWRLEYARTSKRRPAREETKHQPAEEAASYYKAIVRCVDIKSIVDRVFVLEEWPGLHEGFWWTGRTNGVEDGFAYQNSVIMVQKRRLWAKHFI